VKLAKWHFLLDQARSAVAEGYAVTVLPARELAWWRPVGAIHRNEPYLHAAARPFIDILKVCSSEHLSGAESGVGST